VQLLVIIGYVHEVVYSYMAKGQGTKTEALWCELSSL